MCRLVDAWHDSIDEMASLMEYYLNVKYSLDLDLICWGYGLGKPSQTVILTFFNDSYSTHARGVTQIAGAHPNTLQIG